MRKNKQSARSLTAFLVTWAFVVLTVTGIVLYVVPQGRIRREASQPGGAARRDPHGPAQGHAGARIPSRRMSAIARDGGKP